MISIIIPVYNSEEYLEFLYESLVSQTFKEFEVIFINDGSIDKSLQILEGFRDERMIDIKIFNQENKGPSHARNTGIKAAKGNWICFLDSDDFISPKYLELMMNEILLSKANLVICKLKPFTGLNSIKLLEDNIEKTSEELSKSEAMRGFLYNKLRISITVMLIEREIIDKYNIMFNVIHKHSEDTEFIWKVLSHTNKVIVSKSILYFYRIRNGSLTTNFGVDNLKGIELIDNLSEYIEMYNSEILAEFSCFAGANARIYKLKEAVLGSSSYKDFQTFEEIINGKKKIRNLFRFPLLKVKLMSFVYCYSSFLFYIVVKIFYYKRKTKGDD